MPSGPRHVWASSAPSADGPSWASSVSSSAVPGFGPTVREGRKEGTGVHARHRRSTMDATLSGNLGTPCATSPGFGWRPPARSATAPPPCDACVSAPSPPPPPPKPPITSSFLRTNIHLCLRRGPPPPPLPPRSPMRTAPHCRATQGTAAALRFRHRVPCCAARALLPLLPRCLPRTFRRAKNVTVSHTYVTVSHTWAL